MVLASLSKTQDAKALNQLMESYVELVMNLDGLSIYECDISLLGFLSDFFHADNFKECNNITIILLLMSLFVEIFALPHPALTINPYFA
jgi:hypothetical protein